MFTWSDKLFKNKDHFIMKNDMPRLKDKIVQLILPTTNGFYLVFSSEYDT